MKTKTKLSGLIGLIGLFIIVLLINAATGPEQRVKREIELQCSPAVEAHPGDTVTLPCLTKPQMDVCKYPTVEWMYCDAVCKTYVHVFVFREGEEDLQDKEEKFKGADLLHKELCSGNFSLQMKVDSSHSGTYYCTVDTGVKEDSCSTTLTVREQVTPTLSNLRNGDWTSDPDKQGRDPLTFWGTIGIIIAGIAITAITTGILVVIIIYMKKGGRETTISRGRGPKHFS
ncbi:uncharacterized protein [Cebidichthys violaceus]|uniref:uncharacterized protein n=1 Tax=Cebidichthys violaceus TaxID=271503 RepID=UPI0035C9630E